MIFLENVVLVESCEKSIPSDDSFVLKYINKLHWYGYIFINSKQSGAYIAGTLRKCITDIRTVIKSLEKRN